MSLHYFPSQEEIAYFRRQRRRTWLAILILIFLFSAVVGGYLYRVAYDSQPLLDPRGAVAVPPVLAASFTEAQGKRDPLNYIRYRGEELGFTNSDITKLIRIARCESKCNTRKSKTCIPDNGVSGLGLDPYAKNPNSTATGIFQIVIGTWDGNRCEGERWDFIDNVNCAYKIYAKRGDSPWLASRHCWNY